MIKRITTLIGVGVASFAATAAIVGAQSDPQPQNLSDVAAAQPAATEIDQAAAADFVVFRRSQRVGEALDGTGPFGANLGLARRADTAAGPVWIVPGRGVICLRAEDEVGSGWSCAAEAQAALGALMLSMRTPGDDADGRVFGLLPDAAATPTLASPDGDAPVPVGADGAFGMKAGAHATLHYDEGGAERTVEAP